MTIKKARQILGKLAKNISDEELERDICCAELLKDLFFNIITKKDNASKNNLLVIP